jgi:hypothetical protein
VANAFFFGDFFLQFEHAGWNMPSGNTSVSIAEPEFDDFSTCMSVPRGNVAVTNRPVSMMPSSAFAVKSRSVLGSFGGPIRGAAAGITACQSNSTFFSSYRFFALSFFERIGGVLRWRHPVRFLVFFFCLSRQSGLRGGQIPRVFGR